jgi:hypothetical protein
MRSTFLASNDDIAVIVVPALGVLAYVVALRYLWPLIPGDLKYREYGIILVAMSLPIFLICLVIIHFIR